MTAQSFTWIRIPRHTVCTYQLDLAFYFFRSTRHTKKQAMHNSIHTIIHMMM
jgi:hypothetical protein